jgi:hypothetical protein
MAETESNYCNLFAYSKDSRCANEVNQVQSTTVSSSTSMSIPQNALASVADALSQIMKQLQQLSGK